MTMSEEALEVGVAAIGVPAERVGDHIVLGGHGRRPLFRHGYWRLVVSMTKQQIRARYRQSSLHLLWNVVQPLALVAVYAFFFKGILKVGDDDLPYLSFILAGLVPWRFFANGLGGVSAITDNIHLISKVYFPREVIPLVNTASGLLDLVIGTVILLSIAAFQGIPPDVHLLALPVVFLLLILVTASVTVVVSTVAVFARDLSHGMQFVLLAVFFATPIMYPASQIPSGLQWMVKLNPLAVVVLSVRDVAVEHLWPSWKLLFAHLAVASVLMVASLAYMRSVEHRMVDVA